MGVKVGVLGPLEVSRDGAGVPMRGKRRAALLTALVVSPDFAASRDRIIDAIWGEQLPRNPTHALESLVSQLRQNLSGPAAEIHLIEATNVGYALDKKMVDTDLAQFRNLIEQGQAQERNDPTAAVAAFSDALALWRGRPLDGIDLVMDLQPLITELDDLHISTREALLQLRLDLGHQDRVVGELQTLTTEYPFRERFWAMLMLALYRDGRQTEALRAGQEAREQLAEVGSEPGAELGDLEQRILRQDESLQAPKSPAVVFTADDRPGISEPVVVEPPRSNLPDHLQVAVAQADLDRAARLLGRAETRDLRARYMDRLATHRESLQAAPGERFDILMAEGAAMSDAELIPDLAPASV